MKKYITIALAFVLAAGILTGCRRADDMTTTLPSTNTTAPATTRPSTAPSTEATTRPNMDDIIPGAEDTIDPSNGANQSTGDSGAKNRGGVSQF